MTAPITGWTGITRDWLFNADEYTKAAKGWWPLFSERNPLWSRIAEGKRRDG